MLGISNIAAYIASSRISNYDKKDKFEVDDDFIDNKIGVKYTAKKKHDEKTSDLCLAAFKNLQNKVRMNIDEIKALVVVTQNPDSNLPHVSAIVHGALDAPADCACFDLSLGCSGYVYGLSVVLSFMKENEIRRGLLFTADPYSLIVDENDKNTALLFGDAATVTLIDDTPLYIPDGFSFGTQGKNYKDLITIDNKLHMNGRAVFNFSATTVPRDVESLLQKTNIRPEEIDRFIFHQGSKYIVDTVVKRAKIDASKVPFGIHEYGNTVSSSIPLILENEIGKHDNKIMLLSGFGVGLSWASCIIRRT